MKFYEFDLFTFITVEMTFTKIIGADFWKVKELTRLKIINQLIVCSVIEIVLFHSRWSWFVIIWVGAVQSYIVAYRLAIYHICWIWQLASYSGAVVISHSSCINYKLKLSCLIIIGWIMEACFIWFITVEHTTFLKFTLFMYSPKVVVNWIIYFCEVARSFIKELIV